MYAQKNTTFAINCGNVVKLWIKLFSAAVQRYLVKHDVLGQGNE